MLKQTTHQLANIIRYVYGSHYNMHSSHVHCTRTLSTPGQG